MTVACTAAVMILGTSYLLSNDIVWFYLIGGSAKTRYFLPKATE